MKIIFTLLLLALAVVEAAAETQLADNGWRVSVAVDGTLRTFEADFGDGKWQFIPMSQDKSAGPAWYVRRGDSVVRPVLTAVAPDRPEFGGTTDGIRFRLAYVKDAGGGLTIEAAVTNTTARAWRPEIAGIKVGFNCLMKSYPEWLDRFVPTFFRCEQTHFWGYAMTPNGRIMGFASPDPVASWSVDFVGDHQMATFNVDLLCAPPLPARHPQHLTGLAPGESRQWKIVLAPLRDLSDLAPWVTKVTGAPMFAIDRFTIATNETAHVKATGNEEFHASIPGLYSLTATGQTARISEASIFVRKPWAWYLERARAEGLRVKPTATHHAECVYPFFSYYLARKHLPDPAMDAECEKVFQQTFPQHYDEATGELRTSYRIQDSATWAGILADRYAVTHDEKDLQRAARLCDFLILKQQKADGGFYKTHTYAKETKPTLYSAVCYPIKSIMEVMTAEETLAQKNPEWRKRYDRQHAAVTRGIDDLARRRRNLQTEGEATYEDGMISCSCAQLALYALKLGGGREAERYLASAKELYDGHRCLTLTESPDARVNGATLRYWETKYTICLMSNLYNSPCGWTAWKLYADNYLYLLTGEERYLREYFNGLGACVQVIDTQTGRLRWGFTPSPRVQSKYAVPNKQNLAKEFQWATGVFGEQYLEMISDWNRTKPIWRQKWGIDNFVHEIFKCMEEGALENVYLLERPDGTLACFNGTVATQDGVAVVTPTEQQASRLHLHLRHPQQIKVVLENETLAGTYAGRQWIGPGGTPPDLRPFLSNE